MPSSICFKMPCGRELQSSCMEEPDSIVERARKLSPWHFNIELAPGIWTADCNCAEESDPDKKNVAIINPLEMRSFFKRYYPAGLAGKDCLDVGCNSGGYTFLAHELGARSAVGIEIREHWLAQAELVKAVKYPEIQNVYFERREVGAYLRDATRTFDIVLFKGIFFHLADPIHVLMGYCDLAMDTLLVDTPCSYEIPEECFQPKPQSRTHLMGGVDGLGWLPGGPRAIQEILRFKGFRRTEIVYWHGDPNRSGWGRLRIVAKRNNQS